MVKIKNESLSVIKNTKKDLVNLVHDDSIIKFLRIIFDNLKDAKAEEIVFINAKGKSSITDYLIVCQGNSQKHCKSIAEKIMHNLKKEGHNSIGIEGEHEGNWVLLDYGEIILHVLHPEIRRYYNIEELFSKRFWLD
tara:strand:- start:461 stop:871 length:411 start_codon:yes stop_codon:yes gene_type:complete